MSQRLGLSLTSTTANFKALGGVSVGSSNYIVQFTLLNSKTSVIETQAYVVRTLGISTPSKT